MTDQNIHPDAAPAPYAHYPAPAYAPRPGEQATSAPKMNTFAIVSFVSAFFVSLAAVIFGHLALKQIKETGEKGREFALTGLILGYISLGLAALWTLLVVIVIVIGTLSGH
ncbi:DUF4190 domain-containing protein [Leifsonia sp. Leaf264]|uniref:DUF4190 domain-containing protein n=1 Tax=Leifsonia sp. Leaf264 TaxID=1736314 RepID=UPI0006F455C4|nr:DUF4190 domain-containing protein [Leifsonia sp. Leaf264]KQO98766.1 hypothetical protein ASF30_11940 [Leifsonia sp. Leaf264]